jgi:thiol-disulfide isomerase/thioredoxin
VAASLAPGTVLKCPQCQQSFPLVTSPAGDATYPTQTIQTREVAARVPLTTAGQQPMPVPAAAPLAPNRQLMLVLGIAGGIVAVSFVFCIGGIGAILWFARSDSSGPTTRTAFYQPVAATMPVPTVAKKGEAPLPPLGVEVGFLAPEIDGTDLNGQRFKLSDHRGKVVVLDFWGDWCPFCKRMYPWERDLTQRASKDPVVLLGVNNDNSREIARQLAISQKIFTRSWYDGPGFNGPIFDRYLIDGVPTIFLLDHRGVIRLRMDGAPQNWTELEVPLQRLIDERNQQVGKK